MLQNLAALKSFSRLTFILSDSEDQISTADRNFSFKTRVNCLASKFQLTFPASALDVFSFWVWQDQDVSQTQAATF